MPRIDIELTSTQPGGVWTWRAAGARQPKGVLEGSLLEAGAKVGDVLRAECEIDLDGTRVTAVLASRTKRSEPDRLAIQGSGQDAPLVTQDGGAPDLRGDRPRRDNRSDRRPGRDGDRGSRPGGRPPGTPGGGGGGGGRPAASPGGRSATSPGRSAGAPGGPDARRERRPGGSRPAPTGERRSRGAADNERRTDARPGRDRGEQARRGRPEPSASDSRPRPKRLQPGRAHREAVLTELPPEQRAVAEKVLRGGIPSVRQAVEDQNAQARSTGAPEVRADALVAMAETLLPSLRAAEWRDRAEAAAADVNAIGLRDLRAVVAGSDAAGRDDESRALVVRLREALEKRGAEERDAWVAEIRSSLADGRVVRALRVSGRPPDPGARFPTDLGDELSTAAGAAMTADTVADRWAALLEAVVASPVRRTVKPQGVPAERPEDLERALRLAAPRIPALAALLGPPRPPRPVRASNPPARSARGDGRPRGGGAPGGRRPTGAAPTKEAPARAESLPAAPAPGVPSGSSVPTEPMAPSEPGIPADSGESLEPSIPPDSGTSLDPSASIESGLPADAPTVDRPPVEDAEAQILGDPAPPPPGPSGDDGDDVVLVEELS